MEKNSVILVFNSGSINVFVAVVDNPFGRGPLQVAAGGGCHRGESLLARVFVVPATKFLWPPIRPVKISFLGAPPHTPPPQLVSRENKCSIGSKTNIKPRSSGHLMMQSNTHEKDVRLLRTPCVRRGTECVYSGRVVLAIAP